VRQQGINIFLAWNWNRVRQNGKANLNQKCASSTKISPNEFIKSLIVGLSAIWVAAQVELLLNKQLLR
jgi:hypothetical protein